MRNSKRTQADGKEERKETVERRYQCQHCSANYPYRAGLRKHMTTKHPQEFEEQRQLRSLVLPGPVPSNDELEAMRQSLRTTLSENFARGVQDINEMAVMNINKALFAGLHMTPDKQLDVIQCIQRFRGCSYDSAQVSLQRIRQNTTPTNLLALCSRFKFSNRTGDDTPVAPFHVILQILMQLPGEEAEGLRAEASQLTARASGGDACLAFAIQQRDQELPAATKEIITSGLNTVSVVDDDDPDVKRQRQLNNQIAIAELEARLQKLRDPLFVQLELEKAKKQLISETEMYQQQAQEYREKWILSKREMAKQFKEMFQEDAHVNQRVKDFLMNGMSRAIEEDASLSVSATRPQLSQSSSSSSSCDVVVNAGPQRAFCDDISTVLRNHGYKLPTDVVKSKIGSRIAKQYKAEFNVQEIPKRGVYCNGGDRMCNTYPVEHEDWYICQVLAAAEDFEVPRRN